MESILWWRRVTKTIRNGGVVLIIIIVVLVVGNAARVEKVPINRPLKRTRTEGGPAANRSMYIYVLYIVLSLFNFLALSLSSFVVRFHNSTAN